MTLHSQTHLGMNANRFEKKTFGRTIGRYLGLSKVKCLLCCKRVYERFSEHWQQIMNYLIQIPADIYIYYINYLLFSWQNKIDSLANRYTPRNILRYV